MKVVAVCGSPRPGGNTETLINEALAVIAEQNVETAKILLAGRLIGGCLACMKCREAKDGRCHGRRDDLSSILPGIYDADGLILATPVYFGSATPELTAFMDRVGYVSRQNGGLLNRKVGAPIVVARRSGQNFTLAQINYFFLINGMIIPGARYWPIAFGGAAGEVVNDAEGVKTIKDLASNIAWLLSKLRD